MKYIRGKENAVICSQQLLQEALNKSRTSIYKAIKDLKESGLLSVAKVGTATLYALNEEVVWASTDSNKKFSMFQGTILVAQSENRDLERRMKEMQALRKTVIDDRVVEIAM